MTAGADALPWLYGVARRLIADQRRGQGRRRRLERVLQPLARATLEPRELVEAAEMTRAVIAASLRLGEDDQEILRLAAWEGGARRPEHRLWFRNVQRDGLYVNMESRQRQLIIEAARTLQPMG